MSANPDSCRSCGAAIYWLKTAAGKWIPVDGPNPPASETLDPKTMVSHFATCPQAKEWRK